MAEAEERRAHWEAFYSRLCAKESPETTALRERIEADAHAAVERSDREFKAWEDERESKCEEYKKRKAREHQEGEQALSPTNTVEGVNPQQLN